MFEFLSEGRVETEMLERDTTITRNFCNSVI